MRQVRMAALAAGIGLAAQAGAQDAADLAIENRQAAMGNLGNTSGMLGAAR